MMPRVTRHSISRRYVSCGAAPTKAPPVKSTTDLDFCPRGGCSTQQSATCTAEKWHSLQIHDEHRNQAQHAPLPRHASAAMLRRPVRTIYTMNTVPAQSLFTVLSYFRSPLWRQQLWVGGAAQECHVHEQRCQCWCGSKCATCLSRGANGGVWRPESRVTWRHLHPVVAAAAL